MHESSLTRHEGVMLYFPANRQRPIRRPLRAGSIASHEAATRGAAVEIDLAVAPPFQPRAMSVASMPWKGRGCHDPAEAASAR